MEDLQGFLQGLFAIVFTLGIPIVAILGAYVVSIKRKSRETELRKAIVESNLDAESIKLLVEEPEKKEKKTNKYSMLRGGCILLGAGLGTIVCSLLSIKSSDVYFWLTIAGFVGFGMLGSFIIENKLQLEQAEKSQDDETN